MLKNQHAYTTWTILNNQTAYGVTAKHAEQTAGLRLQYTEQCSVMAMAMQNLLKNQLTFNLILNMLNNQYTVWPQYCLRNLQAKYAEH